MQKSFAGGAVPTALSIGIDEVATIITGVAFDGWPDGSAGPINATLAPRTQYEEKVLVGDISGTTMTVLQRGYDGTTPRAHPAGAGVEHGWFGVDASDSNTHVNSTGSVHGVGPSEGALVGTSKTQTLTNKTMDGAANTFTNIGPGSIPVTTAAIADLVTADTTLQTNIDAEAATRAGADTTETNARIAADAGHVAAGDPHSQYLTAAEGNAAYDAIDAASTGDAAHVAAGDPHPVYLTGAEETALNRVTGAAGLKVARGTVTANITAGTVPGGAQGAYTITFPVGFFSTAPAVVVSMSSAPGGSAGLAPRVTNTTSAQTLGYIYNVGSSNTTVVTVTFDWIAVGV